MSRLPDPGKSRALFIGVDKFNSLEPLPAVRRNVSTLVELFAGDVWQLGSSHCAQLLNPTSTREVDEAIFRAAEAATDTLLLYYAGHGLLDRQGRLHLAMPDSDKGSVHSTAFPYDWVRMRLADSGAARCIVILDCCFSARAMGVQSPASSIAALAEAEGTYVLAAADERAIALAPPEETFTAFTGALVRVLADGVADAPEFLDLDTVFQGVQSILRRQARPDPQCLGRNQVGRTAFVRNPAYVPDQAHDVRYDLQTAIEDIHVARSLADTLQAVSDGVVAGLGFELACVNLVRPDGDLVVASFSGDAEAEARITGRVGVRASWDRRLSMGEAWGSLRFIPHTEGQTLEGDDIPQWYMDGPAPRSEDEWHPADRLFAPMYVPDGTQQELLGVISLDKPRTGRRPGPAQRAALQSYAFQAAIAISSARLRANMQRALVRLERDQQALRASEESFRRAFEYAPAGMVIAEMGGEQHGRILRTNDALCRLLGRPASAMRRYSFSDLVHPEDIGTLLRTSAEGGRAELRLGRRDGTYVWVSLRNSVVADAADGPRFLLTHVEDIEERKRREFELAHRASHDFLTGLPNSAELLSRLSARLCENVAYPGVIQSTELAAYGASDGYDYHVHAVAPEGDQDYRTKGLAILFCSLNGFKSVNDRFGHKTGDAVLIEVARRLSQGVRDGDTVARFGGDEFVVLADGLDRAVAQDLAVRLRNEVVQPYLAQERALRVGASFGIAWAHCGMAADDAIQAAREAAV
ncbi:diguanylate cyclase [Streptomyces ferrugineus]|uniref:Diguanylate cyclase n=1 Tax=Streptomyces ferrugineus TaxID=1413221 RepID=A0A7M2SJI4_9ACTN|nr:diguanylate cyclase [Streptomyces ferrugineus]